MKEGDYPGTRYKYLPASKVIELLPPDTRVVPNGVTRNLTLILPTGTEPLGKSPHAMLDFISEGQLEFFDA